MNVSHARRSERVRTYYSNIASILRVCRLHLELGGGKYRGMEPLVAEFEAAAEASTRGVDASEWLLSFRSQPFALQVAMAVLESSRSPAAQLQVGCAFVRAPPVNLI